MRRLALLFGLALVFVAPAWGGGPRLVTTTDPPVRYTWNTAQPVEFNCDQGPLGQLDNAAAVALVAELFQVWQDVPSSKIAFRQGAVLPEDVVDRAGYDRYPAPSYAGPILFDTDGRVTDGIFGAGQSKFVLGFAGVADADAGTGRVTAARAVLNGKWIDGNSLDDPEIPLAEFRGVFLHEFGHFVNLDHTQINVDDAADGVPDNDENVPTMHPNIFGPEGQQGTLHQDDVAAVSSLYPEPDFLARHGAIEGEVFSTSGVSLAGANVIARRVDDPKVTAVSCVSGYLFRGSSPSTGTTNPAYRGRYRIEGLPAGNYTVEIEPLDLKFNSGSRVGPIADPVTGITNEFWNGTRESADPVMDPADEAVVLPVGAGRTVRGVDFALNHSQGLSRLYPAGDTGDTLDHCQLIFTPSPSSPGGYTVRRIGGVNVFPHSTQDDTLLTLGDDDYSTDRGLDARLPVFGTRYSVVNICSNGYVTFGNPSNVGTDGGTRFSELDGSPSAEEQAGPNPHLSALYTDLNSSAGGTVHYGLGAAGLFVTFSNVPVAGTATTASFQVHLAPSGVITFTYGDVAFARSAPGGFSGAVGVSSGGAYHPGFAASADVGSLPDDTTSPTVRITAPAEGAQVAGVVTVRHSVSDPSPSSGLRVAELYVDGALVSSVSGFGSLTWDTSRDSNGRKRVEVRAIDRSGRIGSASTALVVNNPGGPSLTHTISAVRYDPPLLTLTLTVRNDSPVAATGVKLRSFWVEGTGPAILGVKPLLCNRSDGALLPLQLPDLPPGGSASVELRSFVPTDVTGFPNSVSVIEATVSGKTYLF